MPLSEFDRLDHDAVPAIVAVQPGALAKPGSIARWACFQASSLGTWCQLMPAMVARFAAPAKPRGLVARDVRRAYIFK